MPRKKNVFKKFLRKAGRFVKKRVNRVFGTNFLQMRSKARRAGGLRLVAAKRSSQLADDVVPVNASSSGRYQAPLSQALVQKIQKASGPHIIVNRTAGIIQKSNTGVKWFACELANVGDIAHCLGKLTTEAIDGALLNTRAIINRCTQEVTMTNQSAGRVNVQVYEYICKNNLFHTWGDTNQVVGNIPNVPTGWGQASTHETDYESVSSSLYNNSVFTTYYTIKKSYKVSIAPGKTYIFRHSNERSRTINRTIWDLDNSVTEGGYTSGFVFKAQGALMCGINEEAGTVGIQPVNLATMHHRMYDMGCVYNNKAHNYNEIMNINRNGYSANNDFIQEQSGDKEGVVVAGVQ